MYTPLCNYWRMHMYPIVLQIEVIQFASFYHQEHIHLIFSSEIRFLNFYWLLRVFTDNVQTIGNIQTIVCNIKACNQLFSLMIVTIEWNARPQIVIKIGRRLTMWRRTIKEEIDYIFYCILRSSISGIKFPTTWMKTQGTPAMFCTFYPICWHLLCL